MNVPKWPVELPQTYDVVSETAYELDLIETPTRTSAYYKIETRRLHGIMNDAQVGVLQTFKVHCEESGRRFRWGDEQGVQIRNILYPSGMSGGLHHWTVELIVDVFPSFPPKDEFA
jgi:hypothetical protein